MKRSNNGFGDRIKTLREARSMSASDLARQAGVTPTAVWNWERNGVTPRLETLVDVAKALDVTVESLRTGSNPSDEGKTAANVVKKIEDYPLEDLMRAIEAKGFSVSVSPKVA